MAQVPSDSETRRAFLTLREEGVRLLGAGDYEGAIAACNEGLELVPESQRLLRIRAEAYKRMEAASPWTGRLGIGARRWLARTGAPFKLPLLWLVGMASLGAVRGHWGWLAWLVLMFLLGVGTVEVSFWVEGFKVFWGEIPIISLINYLLVVLGWATVWALISRRLGYVNNEEIWTTAGFLVSGLPGVVGGVVVLVSRGVLP